MMVIIFRSKLTSAAGDDYNSTSDHLLDYAKTRPGFVDVKSYKADDGERLTIVWWQDNETLEQWRNDMKHMAAKNKGRERWYEYYKMDVAEVTRTSNFDRSSAEVGAATS
jgi:heme-degrading monooxygenase HmoA